MEFTGPAVTALGLAAARSVESGRADRLIDDPLARHLYLRAGAELPMRLDWPERGDPVTPAEALHLHGSRYIGLRTRFYDDFLIEGARAGMRQAVLLGSGLDTRAYRLALPGDLRLFELDQGPVLDWKRAVLGELAGPRCAVADVGIDLRAEWPAALVAAGFDPALATVFIAEGLLAYLSPSEQHVLLERMSEVAASASRLALDRIVGDPHSAGRIELLSERSGIDMAGLMAAGAGADPAGRLRAVGWEVDEEPVGTAATRYGRDLADPFADAGTGEPPWLDTVFLTALRTW